MPPCLDVYVWITAEGRRVGLERFIERYVDSDDPGDARFAAFERVHLLETGTGDDREALADLRRDDASGEEFSLYLHAQHHHSASITLTRERAVVLGLSLDDPFDSPDVHAEGTLLLRRLCQEFSATGAHARSGTTTSAEATLQIWARSHSPAADSR